MASGIWRPRPGASEEALLKLRREARIELPDAYLDQLATSNGGEGDLGTEPGWIVIWPAEDVIRHNVGYSIPDVLPGFFGFGSNGGGEFLAFDTRSAEPYGVAMVPFIGMQVEDAVQIATSFEELRALIGVSLGEGNDTR